MVSPLLGPHCRFAPTCSVYAADGHRALRSAQGLLDGRAPHRTLSPAASRRLRPGELNVEGRRHRPILRLQHGKKRPTCRRHLVAHSARVLRAGTASLLSWCHRTAAVRVGRGAGTHRWASLRARPRSLRRLAEVAPPDAGGPNCRSPLSRGATSWSKPTSTGHFHHCRRALEELRLKQYRTSRGSGQPTARPDPGGSARRPAAGCRAARHDQAGRRRRRIVYGVDKDRLDLTEGGEGSLTFTGQVEGLTIVKRIARSGGSTLRRRSSVSGNFGDYSEMGIGWNKHLPSQPSARARGGLRLGGDTAGGQAPLRVFRQDRGAQAAGGRGELGCIQRQVLPRCHGAGSRGRRGGQTQGPRVWIKQRGETLETQLLLPPGVFRADLDVYLGPKSIDILERALAAARRRSGVVQLRRAAAASGAASSRTRSRATTASTSSCSPS